MRLSTTPKNKILHVGIGEVEDHLVAEIMFQAVLAILISTQDVFHATRFSDLPFSGSIQIPNFTFCFLPRRRERLFHWAISFYFPSSHPGLPVVIPGIFVCKPPIIQQKQVDIQFSRVSNKFFKFWFIKIEIGRLPVVQQG